MMPKKRAVWENLKEWQAARKAEKELVEESIEDEEKRIRRGERGDRRKSKTGIILSMMAARSREFVSASNNALRLAVDGLNRTKKFPPVPTVLAGDGKLPSDEATMRALFVAVGLRTQTRLRDKGQLPLEISWATYGAEVEVRP